MAGEGETEPLVLVVFGVSFSAEESFLIGEYVDRIVSPVGVTGTDKLVFKLAWNINQYIICFNTSFYILL